MDFSDLIGAKYTDRGRTVSGGFDCYGLAIEVEKRMGKTLQDIDYDDHREELEEMNVPSLNVEEISAEMLQPGDIVEMRHDGLLHIGVLLDKKTFIHATRRHGVKISPLAAYPITKYFRIKD